ncbi:M16 family metallopeptidase [Nocardioides pantholopis]|uniref:M16 family metallopeptidase n=1 Tax=Nocardioides pantholopis TaxID=2483798 RepID=UPI000F08045F|nr:insulinase family protein [Nocardioides pantholopis]
MRLPPTRSERLAHGARSVHVDWSGAPFTEIRLILPVFRRSRREAALAQVLGRLLPLGPSDPGAAAHAERMLGHGGSVTSTGAVDRITVAATIPPEGGDAVLAELMARLESPAFTPEAVDEAIAGELDRLRRTAALREVRLHEALTQRRWGTDHPYTRSIAAARDLADLTPDDVTSYARRVLSLDGAAVVAVGDLGTRGGTDWTGTSARLRDRLAAVSPPGSPGPLPQDPGPRGGAAVAVPVPAGEPTASLRIWTPAPVRQHPDHAALHLFSTCLGGHFGSRLVQELRERRGDVYGVTAGFEVLATAATQALVLETPAERLDAVRATVAATIEDLRTAGPDDAELAAAVRYATSAATVGMSHPASLASAGATVVFGGDSFDLWARQAAAARRTGPREVAAAGARYAGGDGLIEVVTAPTAR